MISDSPHEPGYPPAPARPPGRGAADTAAFARALTGLTMSVQSSRLDPLTVLIDGATDLIPGAESSAVIVAAGPARLTTRATSGPTGAPVIDLQNAAGQGPGLDAVDRPEPVAVPDLAAEKRWPLFTGAARELGVGSMLCLPLQGGDRILGALSLTATRPHAFDEESRAIAGLFAAYATIALGNEEWRVNLTAALSSRDLIGQGKGILMERFKVTPDAAFTMLVKASQRTHTKLRVVSEELCRTGVLPAGRPPRPPGGGV